MKIEGVGKLKVTKEPNVGADNKPIDLGCAERSRRTQRASLMEGDGVISKLECFNRFDEVNYWLSRTRDLITNAETYSYRAFRKSFWELRRKARKSEMELVIALFRFERAMNKAMAEFKS
ncbi:MAG: hypothetical protein ABR973_03770 [Candidatus Acidiferrales bacterium]|jgi:hypothetical protein